MGRSRLRTLLHFVWATRGRLPLVTEEVERDLYRYIGAVCEDDKCEALAIGGMPDHVHLFVAFSNTITIAELMKHVKGGSSRFLSERLRVSGADSYFQWQSGYGVSSVSPFFKDSVIAYIHNQKQHHADGTLWPAAEDTIPDETT